MADMAFVIGVETYATTALPTLQGPALNALGFAQWLRRTSPAAAISLWYNIAPSWNDSLPTTQQAFTAAEVSLDGLRVPHSLTRAAIWRTIAEEPLQMEVDRTSRVWVFWSGHGGRLNRQHEIVFCADEESGGPSFIYLEELRNLLASERFRRFGESYLIVDACSNDIRPEQLGIVGIRQPIAYTRIGGRGKIVELNAAVSGGYARSSQGGTVFGKALLNAIQPSWPALPSLTDTLLQAMRNEPGLEVRLRVDSPTYTHEDGISKVPFKRLRESLEKIMPQQMEIVGGGKYLQSLYVQREVEEQINEFTKADKARRQADQIAKALGAIAKQYKLDDDARRWCEEIPSVFEACHDEDRQCTLVDGLRTGFFFKEVAAATSSLDRLIISAGDPVTFAAFKSAVRDMPFIDESALNALRSQLPELYRIHQTDPSKPLSSSYRYAEALEIFPSGEIPRKQANELILELEHIFEVHLRKCLILADRAGAGKTTLLCHLSQEISKQQPVILLRPPAEGDNDPERWIERLFESEFGKGMTDWLPQVSRGLEEPGQWLYILIDGLNETGNPAAMADAFQRFMIRLIGRRVKLIVSYRDLFSTIFFPALSRFSFKEPVKLNDFSVDEWTTALQRYFTRFNIEADLSEEAERALRNPLLLHFFCLAHKDHSLRFVTSVDLVSVFKLYLERTDELIARRLGLFDETPVTTFLMDVARRMWQLRSPLLPLDQLEAGLQVHSPSSIYNLVRSENMLLQQSSVVTANRKNVRFVYEQLMEFMLAKVWQEEMQSSDLATLLADVVAAAPSFPTALGALSFLDRLTLAEGHLLRQLLLKFGADGFIASGNIALGLFLLEHMACDRIEEEIIEIVRRIEAVVPLDLRDRLGAVIVRLAKANPANSVLRDLLKRMVEISPDLPSASVSHDMGVPQENLLSAKSKSGIGRFWGIWSRTNSQREQSHLRPPTSDPTDPVQGNDKSKVEGFLPPSRSRYSEETKLSAIALLASSASSEEYTIVDRAIRMLGRVELDSALLALKAIDESNPALVYRTIESYANSKIAEYRIYSCWLLRARYGLEAAQHLLGFLTDRETRVHRYALRLFDTRSIEPELIEAILRRLADEPELASWHAQNLIELLGRPDAFLNKSMTSQTSIHSSLLRLIDHKLPSLRLAALRAILNYPELSGRGDLQEKTMRDSDPYVRASATLLFGQL